MLLDVISKIPDKKAIQVTTENVEQVKAYVNRNVQQHIAYTSECRLFVSNSEVKADSWIILMQNKAYEVLDDLSFNAYYQAI